MFKGLSELSRAMQGVIALVTFLVIVGMLWWSWKSFEAHIQAPIIAERDKAVAANDGLTATNKVLVENNQRLSATIAQRGKREQGIDDKVEDIRKGLAALKKADPEVNDWANTKIPAKVLK